MNFEEPDLWKIMFLHMAGGLDLMIVKCPFQPKLLYKFLIPWTLPCPQIVRI